MEKGPIPEDHPRLVFLPFDKAVDPPSGLIEHLKDHWWVVHPIKGLVFWDKRNQSPICNSNKTLTERFTKFYPWAEVRFFPSVFRRINPNDYV